MQLPRDEFEQHFIKYRHNLQFEIGRFFDAFSVFRQISERTHDHLEEINLAPAFFHTVEAALFTTIVMWADKLFDQNGERGLFNFLRLVEYNREWMTVAELQRRKNYPDGHWMLQNRISITFASIEVDREKIRSLAVLKSVRLRRDKYQGHFDKDYFFDRSRFNGEAPMLWKDVDQAAAVMGQILNDYSVDFDGQMFAWETLGIDDLSRLLRAAKKGRTAS
jgi:hypothetical protein